MAAQTGLLLIQQQQGIIAEHGHGLLWSRYTLLLRWSRGAPATNDELRVFCSHYGPVRITQRRPPISVALSFQESLDRTNELEMACSVRTLRYNSIPGCTRPCSKPSIAEIESCPH